MFNSNSAGKLSYHDVHKQIALFMAQDAKSSYRIIIGADSQVKQQGKTDFVTAIIIHRIGSGAIYFWQRKYDYKKRVLKQRIYEEAALAMQTAETFLESFKKNGIRGYELEVHVDVGTKGPTREIINEVTGMVRGSGFNVKTKSNAYCASSVADRHT